MQRAVRLRCMIDPGQIQEIYSRYRTDVHNKYRSSLTARWCWLLHNACCQAAALSREHARGLDVLAAHAGKSGVAFHLSAYLVDKGRTPTIDGSNYSACTPCFLCIMQNHVLTVPYLLASLARTSPATPCILGQMVHLLPRQRDRRDGR